MLKSPGVFFVWVKKLEVEGIMEGDHFNDLARSLTRRGRKGHQRGWWLGNSWLVNLTTPNVPSSRNIGMVNKPLMRPYFWRGRSGGLGWPAIIYLFYLLFHVGHVSIFLREVRWGPGSWKTLLNLAWNSTSEVKNTVVILQYWGPGWYYPLPETKTAQCAPWKMDGYWNAIISFWDGLLELMCIYLHAK